VRSQSLKDCLTPLLESLGVAVRAAGKLPASDEARSHLLGFFHGEFGVIACDLIVNRFGVPMRQITSG